ncbi:hypothetical protein N8A98_06985 [Devosia neptuniae]|uniref:Uncharacterized protein n=1 Tax=Devosia neptuniae TaxID=191302 RepID=A0ABY6CIB7_9HYPH|nr:hypothetical protein [Devosia neptuniae]UXN70926.1 hypothetical protein N8A98_06985 [Devosia neptuniae]
MSTIKVGDTVKVLAHRNAYDEDISTWRSFPFTIGENFVVGVVQDDDHGYPCDLVFPVGEGSEFWRSDDLEIVQSAHVPTQVERIRHYRESLEIGLLQARRIVAREDMLAAIDAAHSIDDVKAILRQIVQQP